MASHASRSKVATSQRSPLAGLFAAQDILLANHSNERAVGGAEPSPTVSELSFGLSTPTSSTFSPPCTPLRANFSSGLVSGGDPEEVTADGTVVKAKIALHHHRTKLQRNVLNEVVNSLQGAYKHCRRQYSSDPEQPSLISAELGQLQLQEQPDLLGLESRMTEAEPSWSASGVVLAGETKEMRKNRQKAESKMRMRRKEIAQFAALVTYAKLAWLHVVEGSNDDVVGRSLAQVFLEHKEGWGTLVALEKRLFHTVRVKLGLQELVVKKLTERLGELSK